MKISTAKLATFFLVINFDLLLFWFIAISVLNFSRFLRKFIFIAHYTTCKCCLKNVIKIQYTKNEQKMKLKNVEQKNIINQLVVSAKGTRVCSKDMYSFLFKRHVCLFALHYKLILLFLFLTHSFWIRFFSLLFCVLYSCANIFLCFFCTHSLNIVFCEITIMTR